MAEASAAEADLGLKVPAAINGGSQVDGSRPCAHSVIVACAWLQVDRPYHVRVLVPCYSEPLEIVGRTVTAALTAYLPAGVERTLYLCDDGKEASKRKW